MRVGLKRSAGFSLMELMVVVAIILLLAMLLLPTLARARGQAKQLQCTSQLRQIHQGLMLYDMEHDRDLENYPDRITHLWKLQYVPNYKVFICPMDPTQATKNSLGRASLKPGNAADDKADWAERSWISDSTGIPELNCSYLYEFSTRICDTYDKDTDTFNYAYGNFAADYLVDWEHYEFFGMLNWTLPSRLDRNSDGVVTWQEAKFWQLDNADVYATGWSSPGFDGIPASWSEDPDNQINFDGTAYPMRGYPRTWMPILRCFWHITPMRVDDERNEEVLNVTLDGNMFFSAPGWEQTAWRYAHNTTAAPTAP